MPMPSAQSGASGAKTNQLSQASKVPQVPEAGRNRPLPRPKASRRAGLARTQLQLG